MNNSFQKVVDLLKLESDGEQNNLQQLVKDIPAEKLKKIEELLEELKS